MNKNIGFEKAIGVYLFWTFVIAWILQVVASLFSWKGNAIACQLLLMVTMYAPFLGVLLTRLPLRGMGWKPQLKGNIRWIVAAWFGPALLGTLGAILYFLIFPSRLDLTGAYLIEQGGEEMKNQLASVGISIPTYMAIQAVCAITYAPFINMFFALGEEIGWRGTLYPRLTKYFGKVKGRVVGGIIWGIWHWPIMLLVGYEYGSSYWGAPVLGMVLFCLFTIAAGSILDTLYEKTKCIWVPALAHGAINAFSVVPICFLNPDYLNQMTLGPSMIGIIGGLPLLLLASWLLFTKK